MKLSEFLRKSLLAYLISVTCITAATGIIGLVYEPQKRFGYEAFFSPIIIGAVAILPSLVTFSRKELSLKQMLIRKVLQLCVLEALLITFGHITGILKSNIYLPFAAAVLIIFILVHIVSWVIDSKKAQELTEHLKAYQQL